MLLEFSTGLVIVNNLRQAVVQVTAVSTIGGVAGGTWQSPRRRESCSER